MKKNKLWSIMVMLALVLFTTVSISSCSSGDDDNGSNNTTNAMTPNNPNEVSVTSGAKVLDYKSVVLRGYANNAVGKVGFCYSATNPNPTPDNSEYIETSVVNSDNSYEITIDGLKQNTRYYYRAFATRVDAKIMAKEVKNFTTETFIREAVDLGLSVKWANCNVGATVPEEYGDYFAWGETEPYYTAGHSQDSPCSSWKTGKTAGYNWASYKWCNGSYDTMTKYTGHKTTLELADDAAHVNWGGSWRMPTPEEQDELHNCTWTLTIQNGVYGCKIVGKNGNSIFLPAAGYRRNSYLSYAGSDGYYWSSSLHPDIGDFAWYFGFYPHYVDGNLYVGLPVRAVCP